MRGCELTTTPVAITLVARKAGGFRARAHQGARTRLLSPPDPDAPVTLGLPHPVVLVSTEQPFFSATEWIADHCEVCSALGGPGPSELRGYGPPWNTGELT